MNRINAIRIVMEGGAEISLPKDEFIDLVKEEYLHLLPEEEVNKDEMYRLVGFTLAVLERATK